MTSSLRTAGNPDRAVQEKRYLKSELEHFGASVPAIRKAAKALAVEHADLTREQLLELVDVLWTAPIHESRMAAVELLYLFGSLLEAGDFAVVERLIRESRTWALVDGLAATVAGGLVERHPELAFQLDRWAADADFWVRRASLLALLGGLRRGDGDFDRFSRHADAMLDEREFFIRKAIGWVLRETSKKQPDAVYRWLRPRAKRASGVTVRKAVKYLSPEERADILTRREL